MSYIRNRHQDEYFTNFKNISIEFKENCIILFSNRTLEKTDVKVKIIVSEHCY